MGKATRKKLEQAEALDRKVLEPLLLREEKPAEIFNPYAFIAKVGGGGYPQLRSLDGWAYRGKSSNFDKHKLALIRHVFARYRVPRYLEMAFISEDAAIRSFFGEWYIAVAQGESLYKTCSMALLTKKETHYFLQAPEDLNIKQAMWWAKTMAIDANIGLAGRMARSALVHRGNYQSEFWIDIHRFFTMNPVSSKELQELIDYVMAAHQENPNWTIKKRSLEAVRRASEVWHRNMTKMKIIGGGAWEGMAIPTWTITTGVANANPQKDTLTEWIVREILSGNDLANEGNKMRHCVSGYKGRCMSKQISIFSMSSKTITGTKKNLTIEVQCSGRMVIQARGLANRLPHPQEREILRKWARAHNMTIDQYIDRRMG